MEFMYDLKEELLTDLEAQAKRGKNYDLDRVDKLAHALKSLCCVMDMEGGGTSRRSGTHSYEDGGSSNRGRRRDSMGRYSREGQYGTGNLIEQLEDMRDSAKTDADRAKLQSFIRQLNDM